MNKLIEARRKFDAVLKLEEDLCDLLLTEGRGATKEEQEKLDAFDGEKKTYQTIISRLEANAEDRSKLDTSKSPDQGGSSTKEERLEVTRNEYENEKGQYVPFKTRGEQFQAIARAAKDPYQTDRRLVEINKRAAAGLNEGVGSDGGFLLQVDQGALMQAAIIAQAQIAPLCRELPVGAGKAGIEFPMVKETSRVEGSRFGGIQSYWLNEAEAGTYKKPQFLKHRLTFEKLGAFVAATDEMLDDATFLESWISTLVKEELAYKLDKAILRGSGVGEPLGILNSACLISVAKESAQAADTIVGENVLKMRSRLFPNSKKGSVWLANQDCDPQIQSLTITKSKSDVPLYNPADGMVNLLDRIHGRPVETVEECSTVGDQGDLILGDFGWYGIIKREVKEASSIHVYFNTDESAFRFVWRVNGQPLLKSVVTPARGSNTLSAFVVLDDRA